MLYLLNIGSIVRHHNLAKYMDKTKYNVYIISSSAVHNSDFNFITDKKKFQISNIDGVNYIHIKANQYKGNGLKRIISILQFFLNTIISRHKIKKMIGKPDIVYASSPVPTAAVLGLRIARKEKAKSIIEVRDLWPDSIVSFNVAKKNNILVKILYYIEKIMYIKSDKLVFTMAGGKEYLLTKKYRDKIDLSKVYNINNGVDVEQYEYNSNNYFVEDDEELNDLSTFKILYTGSIRKAYNVKQILELAKKIQDNNFDNVRIFLFGNGNEKEELVEYCEKNNIKNVIFRKFVDNKYIPNIMSKCNICLLHGKNVDIFKYGTSQNKMFAYLFSGKPIISSFYNPYELIEKNGCGITLKNNTLDEYYEAFVKIYNNYDKMKDVYKENDKELLSRFDYKELAKQLEDVIEKNASDIEVVKTLGCD